MVGRARTTDRIFKSVTTRVAKGLAVCLVLDESGSMGTTGTSRKPDFKSRSGIALQIAVLFAKSLQRVPGVELEIYSYGSCRGDNDNLIKYLYGRRQPDIASICGYGAGAQNYDHMAIRECGNLFKENTDNENRLMLVVSDGAPCGNRYGGPSAIKATHDVVKKLEKEMHVVQIAITAFASEQMFSHYIRFLDLRSLIGDMRKLLVRIIRSVS
jgi:nitric oxide reductase activation protein